MSLLSPLTFASVLSGLIRLGHEGRTAYARSIANNDDLRLLAPRPDIFRDDLPASEVERLIARFAADLAFSDGLTRPGGIFFGVLAGDASLAQPLGPQQNFEDCLDRRNGRVGWPMVCAGAEERFEDMIAWAFAQGDAARMSRAKNGLIVYSHKDWLAENPQTPWGDFAAHVFDVSLDIVATQPELVGLSGRSRALFAALSPNLARSFEAGGVGGPAAQLARAFTDAALATMVERPDLISDELRWQPLIRGVLEPLQQEVTESGLPAVFAEGRLRQMIRGPMAHAALAAISNDADAFLKGSAKGEKALGAVIRATLGQVASADPASFDIREAFGEAGALQVMRSALSVARDRPELFIAGTDDDEKEHARRLLQGFASTLIDAPRPFGKQDGLIADIAVMALDVVGDYTQARLGVSAAGQGRRQVGAEMASHLVRDLIDGMKRALDEPTEASGQRPQADFLASLFSRGQAVDLLKIMAEHVARSPDLVVSQSTNPQVRAMAESVARAIAEDETGLLTGEHWRNIFAVAFETALRNPGALFSLAPGEGAGDNIAFALISRLLASARDAMRSPSGTPGRLLFGETLSGAIRVTLAAAGNGVLTGLSSPTERAGHLAAIDALVTRLNGLAASQQRSLRIGAEEWLEIYAFYIAHALQVGGEGLSTSQISDDQLLAVVRNLPGQPTEQEIRG